MSQKLDRSSTTGPISRLLGQTGNNSVNQRINHPVIRSSPNSHRSHGYRRLVECPTLWAPLNPVSHKSAPSMMINPFPLQEAIQGKHSTDYSRQRSLLDQARFTLQTRPQHCRAAASSTQNIPLKQPETKHNHVLMHITLKLTSSVNPLQEVFSHQTVPGTLWEELSTGERNTFKGFFLLALRRQ